jgi:hypothetical protein
LTDTPKYVTIPLTEAKPCLKKLSKVLFSVNGFSLISNLVYLWGKYETQKNLRGGYVRNYDLFGDADECRRCCIIY